MAAEDNARLVQQIADELCQRFDDMAHADRKGLDGQRRKRANALIARYPGLADGLWGIGAEGGNRAPAKATAAPGKKRARRRSP